MDLFGLLMTERYSRRNQRRMRWYHAMVCLASVVIFCTTYALILPAITMDKACPILEHTHSDSCYTQLPPVEKQILVCSRELLCVHDHTEACWDDDGKMICGYADFLVHVHDASCYDAEGSFCCTLPEVKAHTHEDCCYVAVTGHTHDETCYEKMRGALICGHEETQGHAHGAECTDEEGNLTCTQAESESHIHTDACYEWSEILVCKETTETAQMALVCDKPEVIVHEHNDDCVDEDGNLICGQLQVMEHVHTAECLQTVFVTPDVTTLTCSDTSEDHVHTNRCYGTWELTCGREEHKHGDDCVHEETTEGTESVEATDGAQTTEPVQTTPPTEPSDPTEPISSCQTPEHRHEEDCFDADGQLICRLEEHQHDESCLARRLTQEEQAQVDALIAAIDALPDYESIDETITEYEAAEDYEGLESWYTQLTAAIEQLKLEYDALADGQKAAVTNAEKLLTLVELTAPWDEGIQMISGKNVTYQVWNGMDWEEVGKSAYRTGTVNGETRAYIDSQTAASFFGEFGYHDTTQPESNLTYSYNDIYTIFFMQRSSEKYSKTNFCMDISNNTLADGTRVQVWSYDANARAQQFRIWDYEGYSLITPLDSSSFYVNLYSGSVQNGTKLALYNEPNEGSRWKVMTDTAGKTTFGSARKESLFIGLDSGNKKDGTQLQVYENGTNIYWKLLQRYDEHPVTWEAQSDGTYRIGLTPESNGSIVVRYKPETGVSDQTEIVPGANTRDLIEVNLYDYGTNINELYNSNNKYPGFQQDGGSKDVGSSFNVYSSFNFGNNITSDLTAGKSGLTNNGGAINATNSESVANAPISGAMKATLQDGYPALSDGTSLSYLFSQGAYATKMNQQSIDGLFQYNDATGTYSFNSRNNHAQFNQGSDTFTLFRQVITSNFMMYPFGNFLPFNNIYKQTTQASKINRATLLETADRAANKGGAYTTLSTSLKQFVSLMDTAYKREDWGAVECVNKYFSLANIGRTFTNDGLANIYSINYDEATDFYFGMEMKMNFMQPKHGLTGKDGQQPMVFYFTGDDDVWVYIDGVLFLDLSGIHRHVGGEIDFVNGVVKYYTLDIATGDVSGVPYKTVPFSALVSADKLSENGTFKDYSTHSFNFYYMERGAGSGVCRMNFNFPLLHMNSISVTKELSVDDGDKLALLGNPDFRFQVLRENEGMFIGANTTYDILDANGNAIGTGVTDANGMFALKANQTARFRDIAENAGRYYVRELLDTAVFDQYGTISVDGSSQTEYNDITVGNDTFKGVNSPVKDVSDGSTVFRFNNQVTFKKLGSLTIHKTVTEYAPSRAVNSFTFQVELDGAPLPIGTPYTVCGEARTVTTQGQVVLKADETAVIPNILAGTSFTVREIGTDGYVVSYYLGGALQPDAYVSGVIHPDTTAAITVNNAEQGVSVQIPVRKTLVAPDGSDHTYGFHLEQVQGQNDTMPTVPEFSRELELTINTQAVEGQFNLNYAKADLGELPQTFYYRITELQTPGDLQTDYDDSIYIVQVTIRDDGGTLKADTAYWKGSETTDEIAFTNWIIRYELPGTGGAGTYLYTVGGALLVMAAVFGLYNKNRRRKGESSAS